MQRRHGWVAVAATMALALPALAGCSSGDGAYCATLRSLTNAPGLRSPDPTAGTAAMATSLALVKKADATAPSAVKKPWDAVLAAWTQLAKIDFSSATSDPQKVMDALDKVDLSTLQTELDDIARDGRTRCQVDLNAG